MAPKLPVLPCGDWRAHAEHGPRYDLERGHEVWCPGRAFDHPPGTVSKMPGYRAPEE